LRRTNFPLEKPLYAWNRNLGGFFSWRILIVDRILQGELRKVAVIDLLSRFEDAGVMQDVHTEAHLGSKNNEIAFQKDSSIP